MALQKIDVKNSGSRFFPLGSGFTLIGGVIGKKKSVCYSATIEKSKMAFLPQSSGNGPPLEDL